MNDTPVIITMPDTVLPDPDKQSYYDSLDDRTLWIEDEISGDLFLYSKHILQWNKEDIGLPMSERQPIKIFIDSPGGSLDDMLAFVGLMKISKTPIWTIVAGTAYSAAACILMAGHQRFALPNTKGLLHSGSASNLGGTYEQTQEQAKNYNTLVEQMKSLILDCTTIDPKILTRKLKTDWYMYTEDLLNNGLIDKIVDDIDEIL